MRRPCLSDWRMLRVDGFRRRRSLAVPDITHPSTYEGAFYLRSFCVNGRRGQGAGVKIADRARTNINRVHMTFPKTFSADITQKFIPPSNPSNLSKVSN